MTTMFIVGTGLYFLLMIGIGIFAGRRVNTMEDYLIAGRRLPFYLAVPTIVATWFGAGSCMGVSGTVYSDGFFGVLADPFGCSLGLIIAGIFFASPLRRLKILTISDLLRNAYGNQFERIATLFMIPFYIGTLASQMLAMGYVFQIVSGINPEVGILLGSLIVVIYTVSGGMWAVTITDFIQLGLLIIGLVLLIPVCLDNVQDHAALFSAFCDEFLTLLPSHQSSSDWLSYSGRILMTGLGAIMGQDLIQRSLSSRSASVARYSAIAGGFLYLILGVIPLFIGLAGREIFPSLEHPEQLIPLLAHKFLSPLAFTLFACGLFSAIMSTADSYLLAGTSLVTNNIILRIRQTNSEKEKIRWLRGTNIIISLLAFALALSGQKIFDMMVHSGATLFVAIFVPASAALFWKGANRTAAWGSLIGGITIWMGYLIYHYKDLSSETYEDVLFSAATSGALCSLIAYAGISLARFIPTFSISSKNEILEDVAASSN